MEKLVGFQRPIGEQLEVLEKILRMNSTLMRILETLEKDGLADCYVGAGAINQTVFNYYHGYEIDYGIKDYDIVYYDPDVSYEKEDLVIKRLTSLLQGIGCFVDIKNEARVFIWYFEKYGIERAPYVSVEDAISSWGATVTCIGVRLRDHQLEIYAPYGLDDLFGLVIRPVKRDFRKVDYDERAARWMKKWPNLKKIEW